MALEYLYRSRAELYTPPCVDSGVQQDGFHLVIARLRKCCYANKRVIVGLRN